ncbi:MAG: hypothetical protein VX223_11455 [Myxococcota bacterium]|nr:hypothetical protein [Myxococcota bacterium]
MSLAGNIGFPYRTYSGTTPPPHEVANTLFVYPSWVALYALFDESQPIGQSGK